MPYGLTKRVYKKRYKAALKRIADKIQAAFASKADRRRWISEITNLRMQDMRERRYESKKAGDRRKDPAGVE